VSTDGLPIRVLIVGAIPLYRQGAQLALTREGCDVVGQAATGADALELAIRLRPDVVVMDAQLPDASGLQTIRRLSDVSPNGRVIVLAGRPDEDSVIAGLAAGAHGYLTRRASFDQLAEAVQATHVGEVLISPEIGAKLARRLRRSLGPGLDAESLDTVLSEREIEVLRLLSQGLDNAAIARLLTVSPATVKNHVSHILAKLGLRNRVQAAVYAVLTGAPSVMAVLIGIPGLS
jgi:DNA-binding NarL/FixJ family response regulator